MVRTVVRRGVAYFCFLCRQERRWIHLLCSSRGFVFVDTVGPTTVDHFFFFSRVATLINTRSVQSWGADTHRKMFVLLGVMINDWRFNGNPFFL